MEKKGNIVRYTAKELEEMIARGEDKTDWEKIRSMSQEEVERLADEEDGPLPEGWEKTIIVGNPLEIFFKKDIHIRLDPDVIDWFKSHGRGYQTRINAVLKRFVQEQKRKRLSRAGAVRPKPRRLTKTKNARRKTRK